METPLDDQLARALLSIGAVSFRPEDPFTWASGLRSPVYCDNRLTLGYPSVRRLIADRFAAVIAHEGYAPQIVAGTATAGIPHAAWLAERLDLPLSYVRSAAKSHGKAQRVEGRAVSGAEVVLVEDLVSTGRSSLDAVDALHEEGADVLAVVAIFSYELPAAQEAFEQARLPLHVLTSFSSLLAVARLAELLEPEAASAVEEWQRDPVSWSKRYGT